MIKKLFVLVAVLSLLAGTAYAADMNSGLTRQVWAQSKGHSVVSDGCVLFRIWYTGTETNPGVGVSAPTVLNLYRNHITPTFDAVFTTSTAAWDTVGEVVTSINSITGWHAEVGPDGYNAFSTNNNLLDENLAVPGRDEANAYSVNLNQSSSRTMMCGVNPDPDKISRLKQFTDMVATTSGDIELRVYAGDECVFFQRILSAGYNTATAPNASPHTVKFTDSDAKGLSAPQGYPLVVQATVGAGALGDGTAGTVNKATATTVSILYDQF